VMGTSKRAIPEAENVVFSASPPRHMKMSKGCLAHGTTLCPLSFDNAHCIERYILLHNLGQSLAFARQCHPFWMGPLLSKKADTMLVTIYLGIFLWCMLCGT
jgi:hypothetical protein